MGRFRVRCAGRGPRVSRFYPRRRLKFREFAVSLCEFPVYFLDSPRLSPELGVPVRHQFLVLGEPLNLPFEFVDLSLVLTCHRRDCLLDDSRSQIFGIL